MSTVSVLRNFITAFSVKSKWLFILLFFSSVVSVSAQDVVFQDNFESYPLNTGLSATGSNQWLVEVIANAGNNIWTIGNGNGALVGSKGLNIYKPDGPGADGYSLYRNNRSNEQIAYYSQKINSLYYKDLTIDFKWRCVGENNWDYGEVVYSLDGVGWFPVSTAKYSGNNSINQVTDLSIPTDADGQPFYIGFKWICDGNTGSNPPFTVDDIVIKGTPTVAKKVFYSYQNGNWKDEITWTTDPSGTLREGTGVPGDDDLVVILNGRTVSLSQDNNANNLNITLNNGGFLDLKEWKFNNQIYLLAGKGTIKLATANYPNVNTNNTVLTGGGTTEYYHIASTYNLPTTQAAYNNLVINTGATTVTQLSNIALNGNLTIKSGTLRINDNSAGVRRYELSVKGNVRVDAAASFVVGTGNTTTTSDPNNITGGTAPFINYYSGQTHTIKVYGDFVNDGLVRLTNQTYPEYTQFPNNGAATIFFLGATDNNLKCNNVTDLYNIVLDKGIDKTYSLTLYSTAYKNFRLFGANSAAGYDGGANPNLRKALWIRTGTFVLKGLTVIPSLTEGGGAGADPNSDYYVPGNGALVLDGPDVIVLSTADDYREVNAAYGLIGGSDVAYGVNKGLSESSFSIYGMLKINDGYFSTRESGGFLTWDTASGQFIINGGFVDAKQFRAAGGAAGLASYEQTGGAFELRGRFQRIPLAYSTPTDLSNTSIGTINTTRRTNGLVGGKGTFNINNAANVFAMSGGEIIIYDSPAYLTNPSDGRLFDVFSDQANINVTGGSVIINTLDGSGAEPTLYEIDSKAPLGNLIIKEGVNTPKVQIINNHLNIIQNLDIQSGTLDANNFNVSVGKDFSISNGAAYTTGTNWTIFNGKGTQSFNVNTAAALSINKFKINKIVNETFRFNGSQNTINVADSVVINKATFFDNGNTINIAKSIYNSGRHIGTGKFVFSGDANQNIDGDGTGVFNNIEFTKPTAGSIDAVLTNNITVTGDILFSGTGNKSLYVKESNLRLTEIATVTGAGTNRFIKTNGEAGNGGLTKVYSATSNSFVFPIGAPSTKHAGAEFSPATIGFNSDPTTFGEITVVPVGSEHYATTTKNRSLTYYWRVKSIGFAGVTAGSVNHAFVYSQSDVVTGGDISENEYVPASYQSSSSTWSKGLATSVNETTNIIGATWLSNFDVIDGDYTAGDDNPTNPFGAIVVYYSRQSGLWSNINTWSLSGHSGASAGSLPDASDIVIIGGRDSVYLSTNNTVRNTDVRNCSSLQIEKGSALDIGYNPNCNFGAVLNHTGGNGNFRVTTSWTSGSTFQFPSGDFSDFNKNLGTTELYSTNTGSGTTYWLPNGVISYGNLILSPRGGSNIIFPNNDLLIYGNIITRGQNADSWFCPAWNTNYPTAPAVRIPKTITVKGNMEIQGGGLVWYGNGAITQNFVVYGDVTVSPNSAIDVWSGATSQNLSIGGNLINNTVGTIAGGTTTPRRCDFSLLPVTFFGDNSSSITNTVNNPLTIFQSLTVNKGSSQATNLVINIGGTVTTPTDKWLTLINGTMHWVRNEDLTISTVTPFTIPATSGLLINNPTKKVSIANAEVDNNDLFLNGKLTIVNGDVFVGKSIAPNNSNNDIEYSGGGFSEIDISGGKLIVNGQIRRNPSTTAGILKYRQSGGDVIIYGQKALTSNAKLEILNDQSLFNMSTGTLTIVSGGGGATFGDLYLRPEFSTVTGGEIVFSQSPSAGVAIDANQTYILDANVDLYNLKISGKVTGTNRDANVKLMVSPLNLKGSLTLSNSISTLDVNSVFDVPVSIKGNFNNNGNYQHYKNTTTFNGGLAQQITGNSAVNFYNLNVESVVSLTLNDDATVSNNIILDNGTLVCGNNSVYVRGNLTNNATYTDNNTGVILDGAEKQIVTGTGTYGSLELNNDKGARVESAITLEKRLTLTKGIFDINNNLLTLGYDSEILGAPFSNSKMITSDGVFSNVGIRKWFRKTTGTVPEITFAFPLGTTGNYTPGVIKYTKNDNAGYIRYNNINRTHPGVIDPANVLAYYWELDGDGLTGFDGNLTLNYLQDDVQGTKENEYVAARLLVPTNNWNKSATGVATDNVDETANTISFPFSNSNNLDGEYTAGLDPAIPDKVPVYRSLNDGDWTDNLIWEQVKEFPTDADYPCPIGGPNGFVVEVNHEITLNNNYCYAYKTIINNKLKVVTPYFGHNLGKVSGSGTLYMEKGFVPAGRYNEFLDCSNDATIEFSGADTYTFFTDLLSNTIPNLLITGTGAKSISDNDITICHRLVIDNSTLDNSVNNRKITINGTFERINGSNFISGIGAGATVLFNGTAAQAIGGTLGDFTGANAFNNFAINNSNGIILNGDLELKGNLLLTDGIIKTSNTNTLTILNPDENSVFPNGGSAISYVDGPLTKFILQNNTFTFPIGKDGELGNKLKLSATQVGNVLWTAEYFTPNPTYVDYNNPLTYVNSREFWRVSSATNNSTAKINLKWDPSSDLTPLMTTNGTSDMRVANFTAGKWNEIGSSALGDNQNGTVSSVVNQSIVSGTPKDYTLACINITKPRARFSPVGAVCGGDKIPVSFISSNPITLNYKLNYTKDGVAQPEVTVTALPFLLTTTGAGVYQLVSFTYDGGASTGVVDKTSVTVYEAPTASAAGSNISVCGGTSATLNGNNPAVGTGLWTVVSGTGGTFVDATKNDTDFTGTNGSSYILRWTISNGACSSSSNVTVTFPFNPPVPASFIAETHIVLQGQTGVVYTIANEPTASAYNWSYSGVGATINGTSNSITIDYANNATSGNLSVSTTNGCGTSTSLILAITVDPKIEITADNTYHCGLKDDSFTATVNSDYTYKWTVENWVEPAVNTITDDISNNFKLTWGNPTTSVAVSVTIKLVMTHKTLSTTVTTTKDFTVTRTPETGEQYHIINTFSN